MRNCLNNFSTTDIHILENGLREITDQQETFASNFYHCLLRDHPAINPFLRSIGPRDFRTHLLRSLRSLIREFRAYGTMITPLKNFWLELPSTAENPFESLEMLTVAETFLDRVAELHGDTWSPALEYTWRKAINTVMTDLREPSRDPIRSSSRFESKPFLCSKKEGQPLRWYWGAMMLGVGSLASLGLWIRCLAGESKLKARTAWQFPTSP